MACARCHTHPDGDAPLVADRNGCSLCHADELDGDPPGECRSCHVSPQQRPRTDQGLAVAHDRVPWVEEGCVRCHYQVAAAPGEAPGALARTACHTARSRTASAFPPGPERSAATHSAHPRVSCGACHTKPSHRIEAVSSALGLVCADCHAESHTVASRSVAAATCSACHTDTHAPQQGLLVGLVPWGPEVRPSVKFAAGLSCRSCHGVAPGPDSVVATSTEGSTTSQSGDPGRCTLCHRPEYPRVAELWAEGGEERLRRARAWVEGRAPRVPGPLGAAARARLDFVEAGGFVHGPVLADRLLREAVALVGDGDEPGPELGPPPRDGLCSFCHLDPGPLGPLGSMSDELHRTVVGGRER